MVFNFLPPCSTAVQELPLRDEGFEVEVREKYGLHRLVGLGRCSAMGHPLLDRSLLVRESVLRDDRCVHQLVGDWADELLRGGDTDRAEGAAVVLVLLFRPQHAHESAAVAINVSLLAAGERRVGRVAVRAAIALHERLWQNYFFVLCVNCIFFLSVSTVTPPSLDFCTQGRRAVG